MTESMNRRDPLHQILIDAARAELPALDWKFKGDGGGGQTSNFRYEQLIGENTDLGIIAHLEREPAVHGYASAYKVTIFHRRLDKTTCVHCAQTPSDALTGIIDKLRGVQKSIDGLLLESR